MVCSTVRTPSRPTFASTSNVVAVPSAWARSVNGPTIRPTVTRTNVIQTAIRRRLVEAGLRATAQAWHCRPCARRKGGHFVGTIWQRLGSSVARLPSQGPRTARSMVKVSGVTSPRWNSPPAAQPYGVQGQGGYGQGGYPPGAGPWGQPSGGQPGFAPPAPGASPYGYPRGGPAGPSFGGPQSTVPYYGPAPQPPPRRRRNPLMTVLLGMIVLVVLALAGLVLANLVAGTTQVAYQNDNYQVPPPDRESAADPAAHHLHRGRGVAGRQRALRPVGPDTGALRQPPIDVADASDEQTWRPTSTD